MPKDIASIVRAVDSLQAVDNESDLSVLTAAIDDYFAHPQAAQHIEVWFRLFERFPEQDGFEVFWTVLHALEKQPTSDVNVVKSVRRKPSEFSVLMVNRMLNADIKRVDGTDLIELLQSVATDVRVSERVRASAWGFLRHQRERLTSSWSGR